MEAIAAEAGVAVRTVYSAFGAKREILSFICERWLERARARERAGEVLAHPDPARRLRGAASWLRLQSQEEYMHAMKLFDFLLARNSVVDLRPLQPPTLPFNSLLDVFERALQQE